MESKEGDGIVGVFHGLSESRCEREPVWYTKEMEELPFS